MMSENRKKNRPMRVFIFRVFITLGYTAVFLVILGMVLALYGPIHPGSIAFPLQDYAEQKLRLIYRDSATNANFLLNLVDRRINDLIYRTGSGYEYISIEYLDNAINQAALAISSVPSGKSDALLTRLISLAKKAEDVLHQLKHVPVENPAGLKALLAKVQTIQHMVGTIEVQNNELVLVPAIAEVATTDATAKKNNLYSASGLIPWPPGSQGVIHAFYPLIGKHTTLQCISCHNEGVYLKTANLCISCHIMKMPIPHYPGECGLCHTPESWTDIHFDHAVVNTMACSSCHEKDKPANHYNGPCGACHITENWTTVTFDHDAAGAVDCISCHAQKAPPNHYAGQCSNCHNTSNWTSVVFDHTGFTDCISCHAKVAPANHYAGQCSNCHSTSGPWANARFNHSGFTDCIACHANKAPANHYSGQCSRCHNTSNWTSVQFDHSGLTDCQACHSGNAPANHYPYQCSLCHSTGSWGGGHFGHSGSYPDCISCHQKDRPAEHDAGQCSNCHNTNSWGDGGDSGGLTINPARFSLAVDCSACHTTSAIIITKDIKQ